MRPLPSRALFITIFAAVFLLCMQGISAAEPLFDRSIQSYEKRAATADPDNWCFVFLGDNRGNDAKFQEALRRAKEFNPLFILHGGDIVERGSESEINHFLKTVNDVPKLPPIFIVRGNHENSTSIFEKLIGPRNFTIASKRLGYTLVAVDNADYTLRERELSYLGKMLDRSHKIQIVAMHIPPKTERWSRHSFDKGKKELIDLMVDRQVNLGLFAHIHLYDKDEVNGIPMIVSGGAGAQLAYFGYSGDPDYHLVVVEVKKGKLSYKVVKL